MADAFAAQRLTGKVLVVTGSTQGPGVMQEAARVTRREGAGGSVVDIITMAGHGGEHVAPAGAGARA
jgi:hypothetical protein